MRALTRLQSRRGQQGQIVILTGLTLIVLIGALGLAVDAGRAYGVKARLSAAVDAASIAAARALAQEGENDEARVANARAAAVRFFNLNYPVDFLASTPSAPVTTAVHVESGLQSGGWIVSVSATAEMPTTFMRVLGRTKVDIAALGETFRRDLDVVLVMDTSGSLCQDKDGAALPDSPNCENFVKLKEAATNYFIDKFNSGENGERLGLVSFASGAKDEVLIRTEARGFAVGDVRTKIVDLRAEGPTASAEGMLKALIQLKSVTNPSSLRVILFFSDGEPTAINGTFPLTITGGAVKGNLDASWVERSKPTKVYPDDLRNAPPIVYPGEELDLPTNIQELPSEGSGTVPLGGPRNLTGSPYENTTCNVKKAARNMVEYVANLARTKPAGGDVSPIHVYTIGLGDKLKTTDVSCFDAAANEEGFKVLKRLANTTDSSTFNAGQPAGLYCHAAEVNELKECFSRIASEILRLTL